MGKFSEINKHSQAGGGNWWKPGNYRARISSVKFQNGFKGEAYIIECEVLRSSNPDIKIGETRSQVIKLDKESALGNIASFLRVCQAILTGEGLDNPEALKVDESDVIDSYGADQPLVGVEIDVNAIDIMTKKGTPFTKIVYAVTADAKNQAA
jgi:hypothetical protein